MSSSGPGIGGPSPSVLTGSVTERVTQVLDGQVNPSIAAHGGRAELVSVERDTVHLRLSGGCQGCAVASVTLRQGIETSLVRAVPEVRRGGDVTDHQSGTKPDFR